MKGTDFQTSTLELSSSDWLQTSEFHSEPAWLSKRRCDARAYFLSHGLPKSQDESFRFLPLGSVTSQELRRAPRAENLTRVASSTTECCLSIGFLDGNPMGVVESRVHGLKAERLSHLTERDVDELEPFLGSLVAPSNGFAALSLALFEDAWVVRVMKDVTIELPLEVVVQQQQGGCWSIPRLLVIMEPRSRLTIIERQLPSDTPAFGLSTGIFELSVAEGAKLAYVRLTTRGLEQAELSMAAVRVRSGGHYHSWVASMGGGLTRLDTNVRLLGPEARVDLDGLYVARSRELVDHHTTIVHECDSTTAQESYRGIVDDQAQAVFDGLIVVKPGAQHTNAQQHNRNLILSDTAIVHTKPQLEIEADDVVCSHGATVGRLDAQQMFYLQSRGIAAEFAKQLLTLAFASEIIDRCPISGLVPEVKRRATSRMGATEEINW